MTGHTPIHIDRTGKLDFDIKDESCIKIKISTWHEMIKRGESQSQYYNSANTEQQ